MTCGSARTSLQPGAVEAYTAAVDGPHAALAADRPHHAEAIAIVRSLIDRVEIRPDGEGKPLAVLLHGRLGELLSLATRTPNLQVLYRW